LLETDGGYYTLIELDANGKPVGPPILGETWEILQANILHRLTPADSIQFVLKQKNIALIDAQIERNRAEGRAFETKLPAAIDKAYKLAKANFMQSYQGAWNNVPSQKEQEKFDAWYWRSQQGLNPNSGWAITKE